jgi:phytoene/squalene synthetase
MSEFLIISEEMHPAPGRQAPPAIRIASREDSYALAAAITKQASEQTYYTIRWLVDRPLVPDAYRAYAYFRWVDDMLDERLTEMQERIAFLHRQQMIVEQCYGGGWAGVLGAEERMLADLIRGDDDAHSGLRLYIDNMMRVMTFDLHRKGRTISGEALRDYTQWLATAVTEALHHFIGHNAGAPRGDSRYLAVTGAHIAHMLRDAIEDKTAGYYNVPQEFLEAHGVDPGEITGEAVQAWVRGQVLLARKLFEAGKANIAQVGNLRCRIAGFAYVARFELVLDAIERDGYRLRAAYPERKSTTALLKMVWSALSASFPTALKGKRLSTAALLFPEGTGS